MSKDRSRKAADQRIDRAHERALIAVLEMPHPVALSELTEAKLSMVASLAARGIKGPYLVFSPTSDW